MRTSTVCLSLVATCACARLAASQDLPGDTKPPRARVGFQLGLRTGLAVPLGNADGATGGEMSNLFSPQVPLIVEIGGKPTPHLFIGGYLGLGFGGTAGDLKTTCENSNATCFAVGARLGAEVQFHILPAARANPWLGYGIGYESVAVGFTEGSRTGRVSYNGLEFAHLMAGVDFRLSRVFGLGPFVDLSIGQYRRSHYELTGETTIDGDVSEKRAHEWVTFGLRTVFFP
jgi:hypothetical protein